MLLPGNCRNFNSYSTQPLFSDQLLIFIFQVKRSISWLTPLIAWAIVKIGTVSGQSFYLNFSPFMVGNPEKLYIENLIYYCISLKNVQGHQLNQQFQKYKNLNNVHFLCTNLFQKRGHYSRGDIIQGGILYKEMRYIESQTQILKFPLLTN